MGKSDIADRTQAFALAVIQLYANLPRSTTAQVIGKQVLRSGTSVGAHYREARRSRSPAEYVSKVETALQELDETDYWLQLLVGAGILKPELIASLRKEADELLAILVTCTRKARQSIQRPSR
jgi:four helix bundle protein